MSVQRRVNWVSQQRVDVPDLRSVESASSNDFDQLLQTYILSDLSGYILRGFDIAMTSAIGGASTGLQMNVSNAALFHPFSSQSGTFFVVPNGTPPATLNSSVNSQVVGAFTPNSQNFVGIEYERSIDDTTNANVYIWDPTIDDQTTSVLPRANIMNFQIIISTGTWASNVMPVATVTTDAGNNVLSIEDNRPLLFRLGTAGTTAPNIFYSYPWNAQPEGRVEDPVLSASNAVNPFQGGDKMLFREKDWYDAVMTRFKEITGSVFWYSLGSFITNINLTDLWFDSAGSLLTMRGKFIHSQTTPGMLTWTGNLFITSIVGPMQFEIAGPASVTLNDTQVAYVSLVREQNFQPSNTFTFINGSNTVTATALIGGIVEGDWIVFFSDSYDDWAQVESVSGTTIVLTAPYTGSSSTGIALRSQGLYTMQVSSPTDVPPTENTYWIAKRQDNGAITATIAASPTGAVNVGGILTITTTAPSGVNAGQGVQLSGITDVAASYTGIIPGTVTSVTLTANNTGPLGDLITLAFTGTNTIATAISTWNTANPSNQLTLTSGVGTQIPSAGNLILTGGFTFNGFYEVLTTPTTTTFTVQGTGTNNASSGGGTVNGTATIYLRGIGEVSQGESSSDDSSAIEAILEYIGAESAGDTQPQYDSTNYVTQGIDLTSAIGILDARAGTQSENSDQDRSLKLILGGDWSFVGNATATDTLDFPNIEFYANIPGTPGNSISLTFNGTFATVTDTVDSPNIVFTALNTGTIGNSISLVFNGTTPIGAVVSAWNVANPTNQVSYTGVSGFVPAANTWSLSGGGGSTIATVVGAWNTANPGNTVSYSGSASVIPQTQTINLSGGSTPTLSWSAAAAIQVPGIASSANNIVAGSVAFTGFDQVAYVNINRSGAGGNIAVTVAPIASLAPTIGFDNMVVIARYTSDGSVIVGSHSFRLIGGESKPLDAGMSDQNLEYVGAFNEADSVPLYPSTTIVGDSNLTDAVGKIDNVLSALTPNGLLVGQGQNSPVQSVPGVTAGYVATWNGYQWVSAAAASAIPASYELLNLGIAAAVTGGSPGIVAESTSTNGVTDSYANTDWFAQSFVTGAAMTLSSIVLNISQTGGAATGPMTVQLWTYSAGVPGTLITTSNTIDASTVTGTPAAFTFTFTAGTPLAASTQYFLVWNTSGVTYNSANIQLNDDSSNPYPAGVLVGTTNSGSSWGSAPDYALEFIVNGATPTNLTVSLKQFDGVTDPTTTPNSVKIGFRNPTINNGGFEELVVSTPLSISAPSGASLGLQPAVAQNIYVYAVDNSGVVQLALSATGNFDEGSLQDTELLSLGSTEILSEYTSVVGPVQLSANTEFVGQIFQPTSSGSITSAVYQLAYSNSALTGNMVMELHADSGGSPGTLLETSSPVDSATLTTSPTDTPFNFTGATNLVAGTTYHLVLNISGVTFAGNLLDISQGTAGTPIAESLTSTSTANSITTNDWWAQSFTTGATGTPTVNDVILYLSQVGGTGATGNMFIGLYSDNSGQPGTLLGTSVGVDASTLTSTPTATTFGFTSGPVLSPSTLYWLVFQPTSVTFNSSTVQINYDGTNPYAGGNASGSLDGGATWTAAPSDDLEFEVDAVASGYEFSSNSGSTWSSGGNVSNYFIVNSDEGASNSNGGLYSSSVLENVPVRLIGRVTIAQGDYAEAIDTLDTPNITFTAETAGTAGNSISLVFDGVQATVTDTADTPNIVFTAQSAGTIGNSISLTFNGTYASVIDTVDTPNITFTANDAGANGNSISLVFNGVYATVTDTADTPNIVFTAQNAGAIGNSISLVFDGVQATVTDTVDTPNITFTADYAGTDGNSISLVFDGSMDVATVVGNWNTANPGNTVSYTGSGTVIPAANTWTLSGGSGDTVDTIVGNWNTANPTNTVSYTGASTVIPLANTWNLAGGSGDDVATVTGNWNTANPTNTVAYTGSGTVVPVANTWTLAGGSGDTVATVTGAWNTANPTNQVLYSGSGTVVPVANTWSLSGGSGDTIATIVGAWNTSNPTNQVSYTGSSTVVPIAQTINLSGGSEFGYSSPPSALAIMPFKVDYNFIIGEEKSAQLTEAQFQAINGTGWVLEDGRDVTGSQYAELTGNTTIPDARATVHRMKDNGAGRDINYGDVALGTYEADWFQEHYHYFTQWTQSGQFDGGGPAIGAGQFLTNTQYGPFGLYETQGKSTVTNFFIRINY